MGRLCYGSSFFFLADGSIQASRTTLEAINLLSSHGAVKKRFHNGVVYVHVTLVVSGALKQLMDRLSVSFTVSCQLVIIRELQIALN